MQLLLFQYGVGTKIREAGLYSTVRVYQESIIRRFFLSISRVFFNTITRVFNSETCVFYTVPTRRSVFCSYRMFFTEKLFGSNGL